MISSVNEYGVRGSRRDCLTSVHKVKGFGADFECLLRSPNVLGLHGGIDRDPRQILRPQRPALVRHPQALGQEKFQLAAEALAPMAQVRALVRKLVLEELLSGEVLEVWIIDPAFAYAFVGQFVNMLEQKKPDHKLCRNSRPATVAVQRRDLAVDELPVDLARELH